MGKERNAQAKGMPIDYGNGNSEKEQELAQEVIDQYLAAKADKEAKGCHDTWAEAVDYYQNHQNEPEDDDDPGSVTNILHPLIEAQVSEVVDTEIEFSAVPYGPEGTAFKTEVERACNWVKEYNRLPVKLDRSERWRGLFGETWGHVTFDPNENYPYGMIKFGFENPAQVFADPKVKAPYLIDDAEFIILEIVKPLGWFKRTFPDKGHLVKEDSVGGGGSEIFRDETANGAMDYGTNQARLLIRYSYDEDGYIRCVKIGGEDSMIVLYDSMTDPALENETGERKPWLKLRKYPLRPLILYPKEGQCHGMSEHELVKPLQDLINELDDQLRMNGRQMAWLKWFIATASGVNTKLLNTREPGTVIPIRGNLPPSQAVYALQPKELPSYFQNRREIAKQEARTTAVRPEVSDGFRPANVDTYGGMALLQQQGAKKSTHRQKMLFEFLGEMFEIVVEFMKQMFTETIPVPFEDADGNQQWMPFKGSALAELPRYFMDPATGEWKPLPDDKSVEGKWRIRIKAAAGMPKDNMAVYGNLLALMQSGASQLLFQGLVPEDFKRIQKHIFSMIGVNISDQTAMPSAPGGQAPSEQTSQGVEPPGRGIPQDMQGPLDELNGASPEEVIAAWESLDPRVRQAIMAQMGGGM